MKQIIHRSESRGHADHGWLNSYHSFSFAAYNNPSRIHFGALRVLNDDIVAAGRGFSAHPHENMEIISIPLKGALKHKDNTGRSEIINAGDVQIMSAGSGITHSEMNASVKDPVNFLQIWIFPKEENIVPRYEQKTFDEKGRRNKFQVVVSPDKNNSSVWINQDAWLSMADIEEGKSLQYDLHLNGNNIYIFVLDGSVEASGEKLNIRNAIAVSETNSINLTASTDSKLLVIEIPEV